MTHTSRLVLVGLTLPLIASACARPRPVTTPPPSAPVVQEAPPAPPATSTASAPAPAGPASLTEDELFARKTLDELNAEMPLLEVYFDLDQFTIRDDARDTLQRNAEWLRRWPSTRVTAEGHGDARGTNEYNLALGDRRSQAARDYLAALGVGTDRLDVVSKGEEVPVCEDEDESCWQRNRRVRFVITRK